MNRINYNKKDFEKEYNMLIPEDAKGMELFKNRVTYPGRSFLGYMEDTNNTDVFSIKSFLNEGIVSIVKPYYIWFHSKLIVDVGVINSKIRNVSGKKITTPYILLLPITRKIVSLEEWEEKLLRYIMSKDVVSINTIEQMINDYKGEVPFESAKKVICFLEKKGVIRYTLSPKVQYHTDFIQNYYYDYEKKPIPHHQIKRPELNNYKISLTEDCIQYCKYCYYTENKKIKRKRMSLDIIKKSIDFILKTALSRNMTKVVISWWGGDPVNAAELLEYGIEYANRIFGNNNIKLKYNICSSFVDGEKADRVIELIYKYNMDVTISCDGDRYTHNNNRRLNDKYNNVATSYDRMERSRNKIMAGTYMFPEKCEIMQRKALGQDVKESIAQIKERYKVKQRCTVYDEEGIDSYDDLCSYFDEYNLSYRISLATRADNIKYKDRFEKKILDAIVRAEEKILLNYPNNIVNIKSVFLNMHTNPIDGIDFCYSRCGFGGGVCIINTEGRIFTCQRFCDNMEFCIGTIWDDVGSIEQKCSLLRKRWLCKYEPCMSCEKLAFCSGGGCAHEAYTYKGTINTTAGCISDKILIEKAKIYYIFSTLYPELDTEILNLENGSYARYCWYC